MVIDSMKNFFCLILVLSFAYSCTKKTNKEPFKIKKDSITVSKISMDTTANELNKQDCIFNNDYHGLTTEWLKELKINRFTWREDLKRALIVKDQDTIFLGKGGCSHFGQSVSLKIMNDNHSISDSVFWIQKALKLSKDFGMSHYEKMIIQRKVTKGQDWERSSWYLIKDDSMEDNLYYNGIEISSDVNSKSVTISQYYN